jgi:hypothetical protein
VTSIDRRPTDPLEQAHLALTVIRNPPYGGIVLDDGSAALRVLQAWYPEIVQRFREPTLLVAARRASGQLRQDVCGFCLATALARYQRRARPSITPAAIELLGPPCTGCQDRLQVQSSQLRPSGATLTSGPSDPAPLARLRAWVQRELVHDPALARVALRMLGDQPVRR